MDSPEGLLHAGRVAMRSAMKFQEGFNLKQMERLQAESAAQAWLWSAYAGALEDVIAELRQRYPNDPLFKIEKPPEVPMPDLSKFDDFSRCMFLKQREIDAKKRPPPRSLLRERLEALMKKDLAKTNPSVLGSAQAFFRHRCRL